MALNHEKKYINTLQSKFSQQLHTNKRTNYQVTYVLLGTQIFSAKIKVNLSRVKIH